MENFSILFTLLEFIGSSKVKREIYSQCLNLNEHWSTVRIYTTQQIIKHHSGSLGSFGSFPLLSTEEERVPGALTVYLG